MTGLELVERTVAVCEAADCTKFEGALATEMLKAALAEEGIEASQRDVFVKGVPIEYDLVVPKANEKPSLRGLLYEPGQIACAVEVKLSGMIVEKTALPALRRNFEAAKAKGIECCYVAYADYRKAADVEALLGFPCFRLCSVKMRSGTYLYTDTGDWLRLVEFLRGCCARQTASVGSVEPRSAA